MLKKYKKAKAKFLLRIHAISHKQLKTSITVLKNNENKAKNMLFICYLKQYKLLQDKIFISQSEKLTG